MNEIDLEIGKTYRFRHKRKGVFTAKVLAVEKTKAGDPDPFLIRVSIDTHGEFRGPDGKILIPASPNAWMANSFVYLDGKKTTPSETEKLLRPSLILAVEGE